MKEVVQVENAELTPPSLSRRVSWGAIFAGFFVTMVTQLTLTLLGAAIGIASLEPFREPHSGQKVAIASGIWLLVSGLISIWIGACVAGRLCGGPQRADGLIHGIVAWSVSTCATLALLATAVGTAIGGTAALLGGALELGSLTKNEAATTSLQEQVQSLFPQSGSTLAPTGRGEQGAQKPPNEQGAQQQQPTEQGAQQQQPPAGLGGQQPSGKLTELAQKDPQLSGALSEMQKKGGAAQATEERDKVVTMLTSKYNMDQQQAANAVQQWDQESQQRGQPTEQKVQQAATAASRGLESGALWGFIALILGLIFAAWGGWAGTASLLRNVEVVKTA
jgi:hypothetical protein